MAYPIRAALVITRDFWLNSPRRKTIDTISLEHKQVITVIGVIRQIIALTADFIVFESLLEFPSAAKLEKLTYRMSTTLLTITLITKSSNTTAKAKAEAFPAPRPEEIEPSTILLICDTEFPIKTGSAAVSITLSSGTSLNLTKE